jgi:hypothetical protein
MLGQTLRFDIDEAADHAHVFLHPASLASPLHCSTASMLE